MKTLSVSTGSNIVPEPIFQCFFLTDCSEATLKPLSELEIPSTAPLHRSVWNLKFRTGRYRLKFTCIIRWLLFWHGGCSESGCRLSYINKGVFPLDRSSQENDTISINGILVPVSWNSSGQVVCVAVSTFDEKEYRIAEHDASSQWQDYLNLEVSVQGQPFQRGIEQWISIQSFHVIESAPHAEFNKK